MNYMKKNKIFNYVIIFLVSVFSTLSLCIKIDVKYNISLDNIFMCFIITLFFLYFYKKYYINKKHDFVILSIILSLFMIIGESFYVSGSFALISTNISLILVAVTKCIGFFFLFNFLINNLFNYILKVKPKMINNKIYKFIFEKHPFIIPLTILLVCYLPYIIAFYPGILSPDPSNQIKMFFHIETKYLDYSVLLDPNVYITNHHPVLHTVLLGGLAKIGDLMGSVNIGIFMYSIIQVLIVVSTLSFTIYYMKKLKTPSIIRIITLLIYALVPVFPLYAMSVVKDVIFNCLIIIYSISIFDFIKFKPQLNIKKIILMIILLLLIMMFRNNGIYAIVLSMPFLIIFIKHNCQKVGIIFIISITLFELYSKVLLPYLKITPGSIREVLSVPFQQTARYVKYYSNELTNKEKDIIEQILGISDLADRYDPEKADPVKNNFNKYASTEDLKAYFGVWFNSFFKHPKIYFEATLHNTYGYFYPNKTSWYIYYKYDKRLKESGVNYHYNGLSSVRNVLSGYGKVFPYIPFIGLIVNIAFCNWIILLACDFLIKLKKYKYIIFLMPIISLILVCFVSPVNAYFRYALGIVFSIPIVITIMYNIINTKESGDVLNEK